jgi:hypothetical protein
VVFAANPKDAPVMHIGGRLTIGLHSPQSFERGKVKELYVYVGTPGFGDGPFATLRIEDVPEKLHPVAEIEFPGNAVKMKVVLSQRC